MEHSYSIASEVAEIVLRLPSRQREELIRAFRFLASEPYQKGDSSFKDSAFRDIQTKRFGKWVVAYWNDDPVHEVRIVGLQIVRR
jgi:hypothetical protein